MRRASSLPLPAPPDRAFRGDWYTVRTLLPYLLTYKGRVFLALACLVLAKLANVGVPLVLKQIVDRLTAPAELVLPLALLAAYGAMRLSTTVFTELREYLFAKVTQRAVRTIALQVFRHLHALSLRFHLARQTGGLTRDVERGTRGISTLINFALFSILPTLLRSLVHRHNPRCAAALHHVHGDDYRMANRVPPRHERARLQGQLAGDGQPPQLRDC